MKTKAIILSLLIYPQSVIPAIRAEVGVNRYFAISLKSAVVGNHCEVIQDGYAGSSNEQDAINGSLKSCGVGCSPVVIFKTVL